MSPSRFLLSSAILICASPLSLCAQEPPPEAPAPSGTDLVFKLEGEADSDHGHLGGAKLSWRPTTYSLLSAGGTYSTLAATNAAQTSTRIYSLAGECGFGRFGLGGGYDRVTESGLFASSTFTLKPFLEAGAWRLEVNGSRRATDFDRFAFVNVPIVRPTGTIYVSGSALLNLTSTGCGGALDYLGEGWHAYASYDVYSYGNYEGETTISVIKDANGKVSEQVFTALAGRLMNRLQRFAGNRATRKASLLDDSATLGVDAAFRPFLFGIEGGRDKDHLTKNVSGSLTGILSADPSRRITLELRGGATRSDKLGTIRFIGLSLVLRSIPKEKLI